MATKAFRGVRPLDIVLTIILAALASVLGGGARNPPPPPPAAVRIDSHSWLMLPVMLIASLPVLWWRRSLIAVVLVSCVAMAVHVVAFGALIRCGSGLPQAFVLAFLCGLAYPDQRRRLIAFGFAGVFSILVLIRDTAAGPTLVPVALLLSAGLFGVGRVVAQRASLVRDLRQRNEELRMLRDERAALEVNDDRAQLSQQLEALLDQRLSQLADAAENGASSGNTPATTALLTTLEEDSRQTLDDMRKIVGLLRGGEVTLAPTPSVAHLDALLAQHLRAGSRLHVTGDPRVLPASVELSAYRIVEHLVSALADDPSVPVAVGMRFEDDALELQITGPVSRGADLRSAVGRGAGPAARRFAGCEGGAGPGAGGGSSAGAERCLMRTLRRYSEIWVAVFALLLSAVPMVFDPPQGAGQWAGAACIVVGAVSLAG